MAKKLDATAKDLEQDAKEAKDSAALGAQEGNLEARLAAAEHQLKVLAPLGELIQHITQIKRVFGAGG